jgi:1-acyl-sn-glycerol-3-phosphate acyltransferase
MDCFKTGMNYFKIYFLNAYFYCFFIMSSMVSIPLLLLAGAFLSLFVTRRYMMKRFRRAISWYGRAVALIPFPLIKVVYENHSGCDSREPFIFVSNHRAVSDPFLMYVLPNEAVQVVNIWPFRIPVLGFFARRAGYLNIRKMPAGVFFEKSLELLRENVSIIFFPEGTRSASRNMGNFHGSAFRLALKSKAPIVPLCISGNEKIPLKGSLLLTPGVIRIRRLPAITWNDYKEMTVFSLKNRVREIIGRELSLMEKAA